MIGEGVALRPRGVTATVDLGVALLREERGRLVRKAGPALGVATVGALALWAIDPWLGLVGAMGLGRVAQAPVLLVLGARASGGPAPEGSWIGPALRLAFVGGIVAAIVAVGLTFPPLALWLAGRYVFVPEVELLESPASGTLPRAARIADTAGHAFAVRAWMLAVEAWGGFAGEVTGRAIWDELLAMGAPFGSAFDGVPTPFVLVGIVLAQPAVAAMRLAGYLDARTRAEALDAFFALRAASGSER